MIALGWGLWSANAYLRRVENGELWSADALAIFARIGDALWATAGWLIVFAPTLKGWIAMEHRLVVDVEPLSLALAGLGVALSAIARVFGHALRAAADLKAENEAIV